MKKLFKKIIFTAVSLLVIISAVIFIGSIDLDNYDDLGLEVSASSVPKNSNGYTHFIYAQKEDFKLFSDDDTNERLREHIYLEKWDDTFVSEILISHKKHVSNAIQASEKKQFQFPKTIKVEEFPNYLPMMNILRLVILQSMNEAKNGHYIKAIKLAKTVSILSQKIKMDPNKWLLNHMIGLVLQYESIVWIHRLATDYNLNQDQLLSLSTIFHEIPSYKFDQFSQIFSGEFIFSKALLRQLIDTPFSKRWDDYWSEKSEWMDLTDLEIDPPNHIDEVFSFLNMFFPKYYIHNNRILNALAKHHVKLSGLSDKYCNEISTHFDKKNDTELGWLDLLKPNAAYNQWVGEASSFKSYFIRRCFSQAHTEAVKTVVAVKRYQLKTGNLPSNLDQLIPDFLHSIPIDPFNGDAIKYSKSKGWVYSVGNNFNDDGGDSSAHYVKKCQHDDKCAGNPTVLIAPKVGMSSPLNESKNNLKGTLK
jgi:hypothetical protein